MMKLEQHPKKGSAKPGLKRMATSKAKPKEKLIEKRKAEAKGHKPA